MLCYIILNTHWFVYITQIGLYFTFLKWNEECVCCSVCLHFNWLILVYQYSVVVMGKTVENHWTDHRCLFLLSSVKFGCFCWFFFYILTMQDKHNTPTLSVKIKFICNHCKICQKTLLFYLILQIIQMNLIFSDNIDIVYKYFNL